MVQCNVQMNLYYIELHANAVHSDRSITELLCTTHAKQSPTYTLYTMYIHKNILQYVQPMVNADFTEPATDLTR